jgi:hypothetical protein
LLRSPAESTRVSPDVPEPDVRVQQEHELSRD